MYVILKKQKCCYNKELLNSVLIVNLLLMSCDDVPSQDINLIWSDEFNSSAFTDSTYQTFKK